MIEFRIQIRIQKQIYETLIDSGATGNFMFQALVNREGFSTRKLEKSYLIQVVSGDELDTKITKKTALMIMTIQNHQEALIFDIVEMIIHNIILEMP